MVDGFKNSCDVLNWLPSIFFSFWYIDPFRDAGEVPIIIVQVVVKLNSNCDLLICIDSNHFPELFIHSILHVGK